MQAIQPKINIALLCEKQWAFATIYYGLISALKRKKSIYNIDYYEWNARPYSIEDINIYINYDLVLTSTWDAAKALELRFNTKRPVLFCGHGIVEFINHQFDIYGKLRDFNIDDINNFNIEDKLIEWLIERPIFGVVSKQLFTIFKNININNIIETPCATDINVYYPISCINEKENKDCLIVLHMHRKGARTESHGYNCKRMWLTEKIENQIRLKYNNEQIKFIYPIDNIISTGMDMRSFYNQGDVYLCTSHTEGNPLGTLEAAACGLTVITTMVGNMPIFIENEIDGFLIKEDEYDIMINNFANYIIFLYEHKDILKEMKTKLYKKVTTYWNWDVMCTSWELLFDKAMNDKILNIPYKLLLSKDINNIDFIEIGSVDYTLSNSSSNGYCIMPVNEQLILISDNSNIKKCNYAIISNKKSEYGQIYYIPEHIIQYEKLPIWFKGCIKVNNYHPLHISHNLIKFVIKEDIPLFNIDEFLKMKNIKGIEFLSINTQGDDILILNDLFDYLNDKSKDYYPKKITFLSNENINPNDLEEVLNRSYKLGYNLINKDIYNFTTINIF